MQTLANKIDFSFADLAEAFPKVDPLHEPMGNLVLVQIRSPKTETKGGIILPDDVRETEHYNTQVAKVISFGPLTFKRRDDMADWPEGAWCAVGDFVRVPKHGGDRWTVGFTRKEVRMGKQVEVEHAAIFALFRDLDLRAKITGNPLTIKAFL